MSTQTSDSEPHSPTDEALRVLAIAYADLETSDNTPERAAHEAAFDWIADVTRMEPELCWRFLKVVADMDLSDAQMAFISAGPFEDLLGHHGEQFIQRVEDLAPHSAGVRRMIALVWRGRMSETIWARALALAARLNIDRL